MNLVAPGKQAHLICSQLFLLAMWKEGMNANTIPVNHSSVSRHNSLSIFNLSLTRIPGEKQKHGMDGQEGEN